MSFKSQMETDLSVFFNHDEHAEEATLNGSSVDVVVHEEADTEEERSQYRYVDVEFQSSDYPTMAYRTDTLVLRSNTWRYPKIVEEDEFAKVVRFRRNERPLLK